MIPLFWHLLQAQSLLWLIAVPPSSSLSSQEAQVSIAMPGCIDHCGKVKIPFPFGMGTDNCFHNAFYEIVCRNHTSFDRVTPFLQYYNLEVVDINWPQGSLFGGGGLGQTLTVRTPARNICGSDVAGEHVLDFEGSPYRFSNLNDFMVVGCGGEALLKTSNSGDILAGCAPLCADSSSASANIETTNCSGVGCCLSKIDHPFDFLASYDVATDYTTDTSSKTCTLAAGLIKSDSSAEKIANLRMLPTALEWEVANLTDMNSLGDDKFTCRDVVRRDTSWGRRQCWCNSVHEGNPYIPNGCQVIRECQNCRFQCHHVYNPGASQQRYHCANPFLQRGAIIGLSIGVGVILLVPLLLSCYWPCTVIKRKREAKRKAKYFRRNGGLLLQQHISSREGAFSTKIFPISKLEKATNNFSVNRILGQGGQGTVYKGMLTDGKIVAIKKSKLVDEGQLEHFINELVILSQINHRNVVKLFGCCLEAEVPLLVYEFIPNGTLYHLLHAPSEDFQVTWKMRLQIAAESADALAYLHSSSGTPIYHRDIKSSNILLDEKYRAKVSDFGTSRAVAIEQTHVTTCVMGTYGYLDPEYFQSNQFTEKSDVYSFGVVLVELITGRKPICPTESGGWIGLAYQFLFHMETSRLFDILDAQVLEEGNEEELVAVSNLARQCLSLNGKQRPSMKEVAVVLDEIRSHKLPIWKETHYGETEYVATEMGDVHLPPLRAKTFILDNGPGSSLSIDIQPLMPYTF